MECPLWRLLISSRSVNKHGYHRNLVGILVSDWSISKQSSPLKLLSHMNWNLVGSIYMYGRFCIKFPQSRMKGERHRLSPWASSYEIDVLGNKSNHKFRMKRIYLQIKVIRGGKGSQLALCCQWLKLRNGSQLPLGCLRLKLYWQGRHYLL